jgi:tetratricopeptide (TPR) repeat protein
MRHSNVWRALVLGSFLGLSACQVFQSGPPEPLLDPTRIEALKPSDIEPAVLANRVVEPVDVQDVIDNYSRLLPLLSDPDEQLSVLHRLADLKLIKGEELMADQAIDELDVAVEAYEGLLAKYPNRAENDQVYYQLAKTHDLKGNVDEHLLTLTTLIEQFPHSIYATEVQFRRGEILFTLGHYVSAQDAFQFVIDQGDSPFLMNAHYMKGWSLFKQNDYELSLLAFTAVLDIAMPVSMNVADVASKSRTMVEDLFRVMGLSFTYLGGADALESLFQKTGPKAYEIVVYDRYSELLLGQEQYSDAVEVYQRFIALHPLSLWAPRYQINVINTLQRAGFKANILEEKVRFVDEYGLGSPYWFDNQDKDLSFVYSQLEILLPELANRHYVIAQRSLATRERAKSQTNYAQAAKYYQSFIDTFPVHDNTSNSLFLLGECHVQLANWALAISAFEAAGYDFPKYDNAAESAYAAILAYREFAKTWSPDHIEQWNENRRLQQLNRLAFVKRHGADKRAADVLYVATQFAFSEKQYTQTTELAEQLLRWKPAAKASTLLEAKIIKAHSLYALKDYLRAEVSYAAALKSLGKTDKRKSALIENLAATVYRQAESRLAAGDKEGGILELLRVGQVAPTSTLRTNAEYDAIAYLIELKSWDSAIEQMKLFRSRYPQHQQLNTLVSKMALAYRETEQWELAADELKIMISLAKTAKEKQEILFIAAELYDRAKNTAKAVDNYRSYANTYPQPADVYMEAANRLAELYEENDQPIKRRFWLAKMMKTVDGLGSKADDRMVYLAASASSVLANDAFTRYKAIKLKLPLNVTMVKKTKALEKAMAAFKKTANYGVSSFATEAGYRMADIYAQLSRDLMDSDRPDGLNALELEQYEILLEEQAYPFEENAIDIHEQNASRSWSGIYDEWVKNSFDSLKELLPGRYDKAELTQELADVLE